ncbi:hypothetical protein SLEP1_g28025 [Rubroshorea leprosula]|uniref:RING-type E3 ubiquitin transferase n=1 Tax=Rubroshorea leprosula TaxID=152421 RepID=A0AAV5JUZ0_9ROSI|nr:hypothetical protein SLEP1_g28025 [Rubroshorea leprosula]
MEQNEIGEVEIGSPLPPPCALTVVAAVNGNRKSKYVVRWALNKFIPEGNLILKLLHVRARITGVPTPMGNYIPLSQARNDVAAAYKKEVEWQTNEMLLPYKKMCAQRKVQADILVIESDDVPNAIAQEIAKNGITKLVIGAPSRGMFTRKVGQNNLSSRISVCTPSSCTVYAVSKGKLSSIRPSDVETNSSIKDDCSETSSSKSSSGTETDSSSFASYASYQSSSLLTQRVQALSTINQGYFQKKKHSFDINRSGCSSLDVTDSCPTISEIGAVSGRSSFKSLETDKQSWISDQASTSDVVTDCSLSESQVEINSELEKLRIRLRHVRGLYAIAQSEMIDASRKVSFFHLFDVPMDLRLQINNVNLLPFGIILLSSFQLRFPTIIILGES